MATASASKDKAKQAATAVRSYLASLPPESRRAVQKLRALIRAIAPDATESVSYGILGYKLDGRVCVYAGGWKQHVSLYPLTPAMRRAHGTGLAKYETSKGTVRFALDEPLPLPLVKRLVRTRVAEMRTRPKV